MNRLTNFYNRENPYATNCPSKKSWQLFFYPKKINNSNT